ncbi:MAG: c-type cytochrome [bacterium]|nr:c-type cytochrome [bacterium]MCP5066393.1 c-type cytochrome [bacterium]
MRISILILLASIWIVPSIGFAQPQPKEEGIESKGYVWNEAKGEKIEALDLVGDTENGEEIFEICSACHLPNGAGRSDGTFPQLAGQHSTVLIKQIADIRGGLRDNPIMYPFAKTMTDAQELADVCAFIQTLPIPGDNGRGSGEHLDEGKALYEANCVECHGKFGEGSKDKYYPVLAGQHYKYMLRQVTDIRDGRRRNANPDMVKIVKKYTDAELDAVVDYMSRLEWPERQAGN